MTRSIAFVCSLATICVAFADDISPTSIPVNQKTWRADVMPANLPGAVVDASTPKFPANKPLTLSLREAILLSLRDNPDVKSADLSRVIDKYSVIVAHHHFEPQYHLGASAAFTQGAKPLYTGNAGVALNTPLGGEFAVNYEDVYGVDGSANSAQAGFTIKQPLLKGFGRQVNTTDWLNTLDSENQARLSFKASISSQIVAVIRAYRQLIEDYKNITIQNHALQASVRMVKQAELKYKVGRLAQSDLLQQQENRETNKLALLEQESHLIADNQQFLQLLGLPAGAKVTINREIKKEVIELPSLDQAIKLALKGNMAYQSLLISLKIAQRAVVFAKDSARWQLDWVGNYAISSHDDDAVVVTVDGVTRIEYPHRGAATTGLNLSIPIDDVAAKQEIVNARITLQQKRLAIESAKLALISEITNEVKQIKNQQRRLALAKEQLAFQERVYKAEKIKYQYGRTTTFELNQLQDQLLDQKTALVNSRITLLNQITTLNQDLGLTLKQWNIQLRY